MTDANKSYRRGANIPTPSVGCIIPGEQSTETTQSDLVKDWKVEDFIGFAVPHHRIRTGKLEFTVKAMAKQDTGDMRY